MSDDDEGRAGSAASIGLGAGGSHDEGPSAGSRTAAGVTTVVAVLAQTPAAPPGAAGAPQAAPTPAYASPEPPAGNGHRLDLYLPEGPGPFPVVIWTGGSA